MGLFYHFFFFPPEASSPRRFSGTGQRRDEAQEKEESKKEGKSMGLFAACVLCCYDTVRDALSCSYTGTCAHTLRASLMRDRMLVGAMVGGGGCMVVVFSRRG